MDTDVAGSCSDDVLSQVLGSIPKATFFSRSWDQAFLYIPGDPQKLDRLFGGLTQAQVEEGMRLSESVHSDRFLFAGGKKAVVPSLDEMVWEQPISAKDIKARLAEGRTVIGNALLPAAVADFGAALKAQCGHCGELYMYGSLSPRGSGVSAHFDPGGGFFIQCQGTKRFWVSRLPVLDWPTHRGYITRDQPVYYRGYAPQPWEKDVAADVADHLVEVVMTPGDILYLPTGTIHATESLDEMSVGLLLVTVNTTFAELLFRAVAARFLSDPNFRRLPGADVMAGRGGGAPEEISQFLSARLQEVSELLPDMLEDVCRRWMQCTMDPGMSIQVAQTRGRPKAAPHLLLEADVLHLRLPGCARYVRQGDTCHLYSGGSDAQVADVWEPVLEALVRPGSVVAGECSGLTGLAWPSTRDGLQALLDKGLLELV